MRISSVGVVIAVLACAGCRSREATSQPREAPSLAPTGKQESPPPPDARLLAEGCQAGEKAACEQLFAHFPELRPVKRSRAEVQALAASCDQADWTACNDLGVLYQNGLSVQQDLSRSVALYKRSCDGNLAMACFNLAGAYETGSGVAKDLAEAAHLWSKACDLGSIPSCARLGVAYAGGEGVRKDFRQAAAYYARACDGGMPVPCWNLASFYESGAGVPKSAAKAQEYYSKACNAGMLSACGASAH